VKKGKVTDVHVRIPGPLARALAKSARENMRPINSELIVRLRESLGVKS
jgi:hypothetical protein